MCMCTNESKIKLLKKKKSIPKQIIGKQTVLRLKKLQKKCAYKKEYYYYEEKYV